MNDIEAPELFSVGTQSIVDRAASLGLTWGLKPATVNTVSFSEVTATYDGDTVAIGMIPLISGLFVGARVMVVRVPPFRNYVIGFMDTGHGTNYLGANISTQGTVATSAAGAQAAVPSASWDVEPTFTLQNEGVFQVQAIGILGVTTDQQVGAIRVRLGSASTSGTQLFRWDHQVSGVFTNPTFSDIGYFVNASGSDLRSNLSLTIARVGGTGNMSLAGDTNTRLMVAVYQVGTFAQFPDMAANLATV